MIKRWPAYLALRFVAKMKSKGANITAQQVMLFLFTKVKQTSRYDVTLHLQYDIIRPEVTLWPETVSLLAVTKYRL